ncbi:MAG: V-type ATP synthase subunit I [Oscillospiraceae bacterium]|nr:V-type ATP synthase subunit I [Oscillospiraceae bacterium]
MAVAKMEKLALTFNARHIDEILQLMQGFQEVHIDIGLESTVPPSKKAEVDLEIHRIEKDLQEIQAAHSILKGRESKNMLAILRNSEEKNLSADELTKIVTESNWSNILNEIIKTDRWLQNNNKRRKELNRLIDELTKWERLNCNPLDFKKLCRTTAWFGSVHEKHEEKFSETLLEHEDDGLYFEKVTVIGDRVYFLVICHISVVNSVNVLLNVFSFSPEEYMFDKPQAEARRALEVEESAILADETEIAKQIDRQKKYDEILKFSEDYNLNILLRKKKSLEVTYFGDKIAINGWIPSDKCRQFRALLAENFNNEDYQVVFSTVAEKDLDNVPIKLQNNQFVSNYEKLTEMYSMPRYNEIDPTPVMTVFYMIFFGLMVADLGYGLAVFLVGLVVKKFLKLKRSTRSFMDFLFYLSFPIMGWGLVFGSFCGWSLPFHLISSSVDIIPLAILSIILGYFHIMAGLILQILNQLKLKRYFDMLSGGLSWLLMLFGGGVMILGSFIAGIGVLFPIGAVILGIGLAMTVIVPAIEYGKRWYVGIGKGLYALYGATSYLGDFVSYTRLMALGVAGGSVAQAFNTILSYLPMAVRLSFGILLGVILHCINIFLSMLSAYVHGLRLQFIEFFSKFYSGGGRRYEPFKAAEKNVIITGVHKKEDV